MVNYGMNTPETILHPIMSSNLQNNYCYHITSFPTDDRRRALNTIRYIHANPLAAGMQSGFFYDFSNYGVYERLNDDGITTWHPAFLSLGETLEECSQKYRRFCYQYQPRQKKTTKSHWGSQLLPKLTRRKKKTKNKQTTKKKTTKQTKEQQEKETEAKKIYQKWQEQNPEVVQVAVKFILANCYNPDHVKEYLENYC